MDYRELENRMERNRELIKMRAYDKIIEEAKKSKQSHQPPRASLITSLRTFASSLKQSMVESQPREQIHPIPTKKMHPGKG